MRIIAGRLGGRQFSEPHGFRTHPMSEKIRGALFNVLGDIEGLQILDAFAGSGALAFEAASRGARHIVAIDKDRAAHSSLDRNLDELGLSAQVDAVRANTGGWSIHNAEKQFDIVFLDPPYDELQTDLLQTLIKRHAKPSGLVVLSWPGKTEHPEFKDTTVVVDKNYGDAQLVFYRKYS